jgi:ribosomal protein S8E
MKTILIAMALLCSGIVDTAQEPKADRIRIGTYDSRAIAIAYAASDYNPVKEKMKEYDQAKAAGDQQRIKELEAWGEKHQRQLHRQGFANVPVHELLAQVKAKLPDIAKAHRLTAIVRQCDFVLENVEVVDVTQELVALFDPSEQVLKNVAMIKDKPYADLDELDKHQHRP